jgi:hypothetical protein
MQLSNAFIMNIAMRAAGQNMCIILSGHRNIRCRNFRGNPMVSGHWTTRLCRLGDVTFHLDHEPIRGRMGNVPSNLLSALMSRSEKEWKRSPDFRY